jgi:polar amino acid transport system permease protein
MDYNWNFNVIWDYRQVFFQGATVTIQLTIYSIAIGMPLGLVSGMMRSSNRVYLRWPNIVFIEFFRSTPTLVQLVWIFYALPILTSQRLDSMTSVTLGLGLHTAAYVAEIFRAGINSLDRGQHDASMALGMSYLQRMRRIILPQAVRRMVPPFINEFANLMKLTTLASVLAVYELLHQANNLISHTFRPLEIYTALALGFFVLIFPVIYSAQHLEKFWKVRS